MERYQNKKYINNPLYNIYPLWPLTETCPLNKQKIHKHECYYVTRYMTTSHNQNIFYSLPCQYGTQIKVSVFLGLDGAVSKYV